MLITEVHDSSILVKESRSDADPVQPMAFPMTALVGNRPLGQKWAVELAEDFLVDQFQGNTEWSANGFGTGAAVSAVASGPFLSHGACGAVGLATGSTATGSALHRLGRAIFPIGFGATDVEFRIRHSSTLSNGVDDYGVRVGLGNHVAANTLPTVGVSFAYLPLASATHWVAEIIMPTQGTVRVVTNEPLTPLVYRRLRIQISGDGRMASFFIDDRAVAQIAITEPLDAGTLRAGPYLHIFKSLGTASRSLVADYVALTKQVERT